MNLNFVHGDVDFKEHGGVFVTKKLNSGDFDYFIFCEVVNLKNHDISTKNKYMFTLSVVSPTEPSKETVDDSLKDYLDVNETREDLTDLDIATALHDYGVSAQVFNVSGNNINKMFANIRKKCNEIKVMFGFYMDKPINMVGDTGWDFVKGLGGFKLK